MGLVDHDTLAALRSAGVVAPADEHSIERRLANLVGAAGVTPPPAANEAVALAVLEKEYGLTPEPADDVYARLDALEAAYRGDPWPPVDPADVTDGRIVNRRGETVIPEPTRIEAEAVAARLDAEAAAKAKGPK